MFGPDSIMPLGYALPLGILAVATVAYIRSKERPKRALQVWLLDILRVCIAISLSELLLASYMSHTLMPALGHLQVPPRAPDGLDPPLRRFESPPGPPPPPMGRPDFGGRPQMNHAQRYTAFKLHEALWASLVAYCIYRTLGATAINAWKALEGRGTLKRPAFARGREILWGIFAVQSVLLTLSLCLASVMVGTVYSSVALFQNVTKYLLYSWCQDSSLKMPMVLTVWYLAFCIRLLLLDHLTNARTSSPKLPHALSSAAVLKHPGQDPLGSALSDDIEASHGYQLREVIVESHAAASNARPDPVGSAGSSTEPAPVPHMFSGSVRMPPVPHNLMAPYRVAMMGSRGPLGAVGAMAYASSSSNQPAEEQPLSGLDGIDESDDSSDDSDDDEVDLPSYDDSQRAQATILRDSFAAAQRQAVLSNIKRAIVQ